MQISWCVAILHTGSPQGLWAMLELLGSYSWAYVELYRLVHVGLLLILLAQKLGVWVSIEVSLQFWGHVGANVFPLDLRSKLSPSESSSLQTPLNYPAEEVQHTPSFPTRPSLSVITIGVSHSPYVFSSRFLLTLAYLPTSSISFAAIWSPPNPLYLRTSGKSNPSVTQLPPGTCAFKASKETPPTRPSLVSLARPAPFARSKSSARPTGWLS